MTQPSDTAARMAATLEQAFAPSALEVLDESWQHAGHAGANASGQGSHFSVRIRSQRFAGLGRVAQHRLVYDALHSFFAEGVHAVALETST